VATLERRAVPTRSCVVCRTGRDKRDLLRVVRSPDGVVRYDPTSRANGRGAYLCRDAACIEAGARKGALPRALAAPVPTDLIDELLTTIQGGDRHGSK